MPRLLFQKTGNAIWMSHLDLMRLFQRGFKRAGLYLKHTQGFNPRPSVSIALPLSVGVESYCELLDFELEGERLSCDEIMQRLNRSLVQGVHVLAVYEEGRKIRDLALLDAVITLEYDNGIPDGFEDVVTALFSQAELMVEKKGKNGVQEQNIIPMIRSIFVRFADEHTAQLHCRICCQNPTLNPMQLAAAIERYLPEMKPNFVECRRVEILDGTEKIFR